MNENLELYEKFRAVPEEAKKIILGGNLNGFTDINPMWRIKMLTEQFGVCGFGWVPRLIEKHIEIGANNDKVAVVDIALKVCYNGEWSEDIYGTGGAIFVRNTKNGLTTNDEAFKMAYTDAISVACKQLGIGADVYWEKDNTKYTKGCEAKTEEQTQPIYICQDCGCQIKDGKTESAKTIAEKTHKRFGKILCVRCSKKVIENEKNKNEVAK